MLLYSMGLKVQDCAHTLTTWTLICLSLLTKHVQCKPDGWCWYVTPHVSWHLNLHCGVALWRYLFILTSNCWNARDTVPDNPWRCLPPTMKTPIQHYHHESSLLFISNTWSVSSDIFLKCSFLHHGTAMEPVLYQNRLRKPLRPQLSVIPRTGDKLMSWLWLLLTSTCMLNTLVFINSDSWQKVAPRTSLFLGENNFVQDLEAQRIIES